MARQILDHYIFKLISKKLFVWTAATVLVCFDKISSEQWVALSIAYIGTQGFIDLAVSWKTGVVNRIKQIVEKTTEEVRENKEV